MSPLPTNPFRPGVGTPPPYLADRERQLLHFARFLDAFPARRQNVRLTGLRGVGKTVLLKEYRNIARERGWVVIRRDLSKRLNDEADFAIAISDDLKAAAAELSSTAKVADLLKRAVAAIDEVKFGPVKVSRGQGSPQPVLEDRVRDALLRVGELAKEAGRGAVFLYDEAHVLADHEKQQQFPLSALIGAFVEVQDDDEGEFPVMLVMSGLPPLVRNLQDARSHSERLFRAEELSNLSLTRSADDALSPAEQALVKPAEDVGVTIEPGTAHRVVNRVDGYPYFIQKFGEALWDAADDAGETEIGELLLERTEVAIQDSLDSEFFEGRYGDATAGDQRTLRIAASLGDERFEISRLIEEITSRKPNATQQSVNRLLQRNLIYRFEQGVYAYTAPLFGEFVRRKHPREAADA